MAGDRHDSVVYRSPRKTSQFGYLNGFTSRDCKNSNRLSMVSVVEPGINRKGGISMKSLMRWDPFRSLARWDPFDELRSMQRELDRLFNRVLGSSLSAEETRTLLMPSVESYTKDGQLVFKAELPGVDAKDLDVSISDRELIIKGERKREKEAKESDYEYREISYGSFERHFALPEGVQTDSLKAKFNNGILEVTMLAPAVSRARKIEIETSKEEKAQIKNETSKKAA